MTAFDNAGTKWRARIAVASVLLLFFTIPHILEDFATGEPSRAGVPAPLLSLVVSAALALQALGLYWLGGNRRWGQYVHAGIGLFWPLASGVAQLPAILSGAPYRSGLISIIYVGGIILVGLLLSILSVFSLRARSQAD